MSQAPVVDRIRIIPRPDDFLDRQVGASGEVFFDKQANTLRVYSGKVEGGFTLIQSNNLAQNLQSSGVAVLEKNITVGVDNESGQANGVFYINSEEKPELNLVRGYTYIFDQTDNTNKEYNSNTHPFMLANSGQHFNDGVTYLLDEDPVSMNEYIEGFIGATTRKVILTVKTQTPDSLTYLCHYHAGMGNDITVSDPGTGSGTGSGASVTISETAPADIASGSIWFDSSTGNLFIYYTDSDSSQWIQPTIGGPLTYSYDNLTDTPTIPTDVNQLADSENLLGGVDLTAFSVTTASASGNGALEYDNATGVFTFTPSAATVDSEAITTALGYTPYDASVNSEGFLTTESDTLATVTARGASTSATITANSFASSGTGTPEIESASTLTLTAPDGVIVSSQIDITTFAQLTPLTAEPIGMTAGAIAIADRTNWDPLAIGSGNAYPVFYDGTTWVAMT